MKIDVKIDDNLPPKILKAKQAIFGDGKENDGLIANIQALVGSFQEIKGALDSALASVKALPTGPSEVKAAAEGAQLAGMELARTPGRIGDNVKLTGKVPALIKQFLDTVKGTLEEIQNAARSFKKDGAGGAEGTTTVAAVTVAVEEHKAASE